MPRPRRGSTARAPGEASLDPDLDGLDNLGEQLAGTNPHLEDTDGDGYSDGFEVDHGSNPLDVQSFPVAAVPVLGVWGVVCLALSLAAVTLRRRAASTRALP
jgi:hypothetical protein